MIGYALSIIITVVSCTLMVTGGVYEKDITLLWYLRPIPSFCFGRIMHILVDPCAWNHCLGRLDEMPAESYILKISPSTHKLIFGDESDLIAFKDETELIDEDEDAKNER